MSLDWLHNRRFIRYFILSVLTGVWGYILFQITGDIEDHRQPGEPVQLEEKTARALPGRPVGHKVYQADFRDPFVWNAALFDESPDIVESVNEISNDTEDPFLLPLLLRGTIGQTAIIEGSSADVFFVNVGDSVADIRIVDVLEDYVTVHINGATDTLWLHESDVVRFAGDLEMQK